MIREYITDTAQYPSDKHVVSRCRLFELSILLQHPRFELRRKLAPRSDLDYEFAIFVERTIRIERCIVLCNTFENFHDEPFRYSYQRAEHLSTVHSVVLFLNSGKH